MNVRIPFRALGLPLLLALTPALAASQTIPSPYRYIGMREGVGLVVGTASVGTGRFGYGPSGGTLVGARWEVDFSGPIGLEGLVTGMRGTRDIIDPTRAVGRRTVGSVNTTVATVEGRLRFSLTGDRTWHRIAPFLVTGGGVAFDASGTQSADSLVSLADRFKFSPSFIGTAGGGVRWFVTQRWELRGDAIFSLWKLKTPPGFMDTSLGFVSVAKSEWVSGSQFTLSALLRF